MIKKKLTKLEQMGIIALVVVAACFFYVKKVYEPEYKKVKELHKKHIELLGEVKVLKRKQGGRKSIFSSIREREEELEGVKSELKKASLALAGKEELSEVLTMISVLAKEHNLKIREFSPVDDKELQNSETVFQKRNLYNLIMVGGFLDFKDFLKSIEHLPKLVTIERVVVKREDEEGLKLELLISI
ncbi:MAG: type 4a pilus biogenesis protein PilO [Candidatus Omnitrophica bacterium]|nr:type 4a pilus biogenesis protein PilO [Candidatus Omnitrophota bacterium]